jgi:His/Glu/Gln/Arg/opine family amino acid ABC transporter permease subunit
MLENFFQEIFNSAQRNLITGDAYLTVINGLWVTIIISFLGLFFGSIWGGILCFFRMSKIRVLKLLSQSIIAILRGSPVLLLLMILYYVAFANSRIDATYIAIIAFALNSGAHIAEILRSSIEAVDIKQLEAARMLGLSKIQAFFAITVPQAGKIAKPVYQSAVVNLIQWTSVVGYVTITDLTRTLNVMGARTGDAFFVLFLGVLIYLGLSYLVYALFSLGNKKESMQ